MDTIEQLREKGKSDSEIAAYYDEEILKNKDFTALLYRAQMHKKGIGGPIDLKKANELLDKMAQTPMGKLKNPDFLKYLQERGIEASIMYFTIFDEIEKEKINKITSLQSKYKPDPKEFGLHTIYLQDLKKDEPKVNKALKKIHEAGYYEKNYSQNVNAFKLHISLNDIKNIKLDIISGLILLFKEEAENDPNLAFYYKIIHPEDSDRRRFSSHDQITIYFNKYSSIEALRKLADKVDTYLKDKGLKDTNQPLGPKDCFALNSFTSGRYDANKLHEIYAVHSFFDLEIEKFFKRYSAEKMRHIPLCAMDAVFCNLLLNKEILLPKANNKLPLSEKDSFWVQNEFDTMLANPILYLNAYREIKDDKTDALIAKTLNQKISTDEISSDSTILKPIIDTPAQEKQAILVRAGFNASFEILEEKAKTLKIKAENDPSYKSASTAADNIVTKLKNAQNIFINSNTGTNDLMTFKNDCEQAISKEDKNTLEQHRGWKQALLNIVNALVAVITLSASYLATGKFRLFSSPTDSAKKLSKVEKSIHDLSRIEIK